MKKIIILAGLLLAGVGAIAQTPQVTYTPEYIKHLKNCVAYTDEYSTSIPTEDVNSPYLKVKSTEEVLGYLNGKCYTKSTVYSYDLDKVILTIKCGLTRKQLADVVQKMYAVNRESNKENKKILQDKLTKIIENNEICRVRNYLNDEE
ncbi:hypothetical protein J6N69_03050 [bacterium]|nr:hypothetical protein [bacterium]